MKTLKYSSTFILGLFFGSIGVVSASYIIPDNSVSTAKIVNLAVTSGKIASGAVGNTQLASNSVATGNIQANAVTSTQIASGAVGNSQLASNAVGSANIQSGAVGNAQLASNSVATANIQTDAVTTSTIADQNVTQAKLAARSTGTTVGAGGIAVSNSSGSFTTTSTSFVDVTNLSVTITTTGRPVSVFIINDGGGVQTNFSVANTTLSLLTANLRYVRGSTEITQYGINLQVGSVQTLGMGSMPPGTVDVVAAGTYTYKVQILVGASSSSGSLSNAKLVAYEL